MAVFPVMASIGYSARTEFKEILRVYPSLTYRRYKKSNSAHKARLLSFENISQANYDLIEAFFIARKQQAGSDQEFYVYDPNTVSAIDPSGVSATGRHTAIFMEDAIEFTRSGRCRYSGEVAVLFLN